MTEKNKSKGIILVIITAILWSFVAIALKITTIECSPILINWFRFTFAFLFLFGYFLYKDINKLRILLRPGWKLTFASIGLSINYIGYIYGVKYTSPSTTQIIVQLAPAMFATSGFIFFNEKISYVQLGGFILAIAGLILFYNRQSHHLANDLHIFNTGILWILLAATGWTLYAILQKKAAFDFPALQMNLVIFGLPAIFFTPITDFSGLSAISPLSWFLLVFLGFNTLISYVALSAALKYIEANKASVIITLNPILTFITMSLMNFLPVALIPKETFSLSAIAGAILVIGGCVLVVGWKKKQN